MMQNSHILFKNVPCLGIGSMITVCSKSRFLKKSHFYYDLHDNLQGIPIGTTLKRILFCILKSCKGKCKHTQIRII